MINDITQTTKTDLDNVVDDFSVDTMETDGAQDQKETSYMNSNWSKQLGYFKSIPELNRAVTYLAIWTAGKGFTTDSRTQAILNNITGWGEDTFTSIMINMLKVKKFGQDAFSEIIRDKETSQLINLKPLDTGSIKIVVDSKGIIIRYEQVSKIKGIPNKIIQPENMLHLSNERIADEIHGTSIMDSVEWVILARNEAMRDWKRISHRSTVRILYVEESDKARLAALKTEYADAINKGEVMIIPGKPGEAGFQDLTLPPAESFLAWIRYLENFFYQAVGIPRVIATSENFTESSSKIGFLTFEPIYTNEQHQLESDLWNQLGIKIKFNRPPSLGGALERDEMKDTGQIGFQPNDTEAGVGK